jgi:hypothetical protein
MDEFSGWLASTPLSDAIRDASWVIPTTQCVHILAICVVMGGAVMLSLRALGMATHDGPIKAYVRRYVPWMGVALLVLLLSGATLIIGEPNRTLQNPVFWTKMVLVLTAVILTATFALPVRRDAHYWDVGSRRRIGVLLVIASLVVWVAVVACGRWVAYVL